MKNSRKTDEAATTRKGCERTKRSAGSRAAGGWTRRKLVQWATARVLTSELQRLKKEGTDIRAYAERQRHDITMLKIDVERLKEDNKNLLEGGRRWRVEAVKLHKMKEAVESAIAQASNDPSSATPEVKP